MLGRYGPWIAWGAALWGVLKIADLPIAETHTLCGPWGCGPPLTALIACHAAWLVILAPIALLVPIRMMASHCRWIGWGLIAMGILSIVGIGAYETFTWLPAMPEAIKPYFARRWAFTLATWTDLPILQAILLGFVFVWLASEPGSADNSVIAGTMPEATTH